MEVLVRELCAGLSTVTPADVFQQLQTYVVPEGTTFKSYFIQLKLLVNNTTLMGFCDEGTLQFAIKQSTTDQFAVLTAPVYSGRNFQALPFESVAKLLTALEDLAQNTAQATKSKRVVSSGGTTAVGSVPRASKGYGRGRGGFHNRNGSSVAGSQIMVVGSARRRITSFNARMPFRKSATSSRSTLISRRCRKRITRGGRLHCLGDVCGSGLCRAAC